MRFMVGLFNYGLVALFGIALSAEFSGADRQNRSAVKLTLFSVCVIVVQLLCWMFFGMEFTKMIYPFIVHIPLTIFLVTAFHQTWSGAAVSVLCAYLCCQFPLWIAALSYLFSADELYRHLLYIAATILTYLLLHRYAVKPTQKLLTRSRQSALALGIFPLLYYLFDYVTTVYTNLLYSGNPFVVQFMPFVMASAYFFFLLIYHSKLEEQEKSQREQDLLSLQLRRSNAEFSAMQQMQEQARQYRHDLRHHFSLLLTLAEAGKVQEVIDYLRTIRQNLDTFAPQRFCGNEVIDLLLSHFTGRAESVGVKLLIDAKLPSSLPFENTELCSLLSNGLENAILAAGKVSEPTERTVTVLLCLRQKNFLLSIENPYTDNISFADGLPVADRTDHGFGTQSISSIVRKHNGQVSFSAKDNRFLLRVVLPMNA